MFTALLSTLSVATTVLAAPADVLSTERDRAAFEAAGVQDDFIAVAGPAAQRVRDTYDIPASVTVAQAAHESAWGGSKLSANDKNYFGYKCVSPGDPGPIAVSCREYQTEECTPTCHITTAYFRVYRSMEDSFRDYGRLLTTSSHYTGALPYRHQPDAFIREVAKKYATDPNYANKIINLMQAYNLYRFDTFTRSTQS
ncbi:glucosaminidase domain-containing protein, partial [Lentzea atacamensis]|uniref:glucosaminidase domain-containing protein n=1 Tax=Lentzea atacamensis TaxID=531938 RepID=UPI001F2B45AD